MFRLFIFFFCLLFAALYSSCSRDKQENASYTNHSAVTDNPAGGLVYYGKYRGEDSLRIDSMITVANDLKHNFPDSSLRILDQALRQSNTFQYLKGISQALIVKSLVLVEKGQYYEAIESIKSARDHINEPKQLAQWHMNTAVVYANIEDYQKQLFHYLAALKELELIGDSSSVMYTYTYANISRIWMLLREDEKSNYYYERALKMAEQNLHSVDANAWREVLASLYNSRASYLIDNNNAVEALKLLSKTLSVVESIAPLSKRKSEAYLLSGLAYIKAGNPARAREMVMAYQGLNKTGDAYTTYIVPNMMLSKIAFAEADYSSSIHYSDIAIHNAAKTGLSSSAKLIGVLETKAEAQTRLGLHKEANSSFKQVLELIDSSYNNEKTNANRKLDFIYQSTLKDKEISNNQLLLAQKNNQLNRQRIIIGAVIAGMVLLLLVIINYRNRQKLQRKAYELRVRDEELRHLKSITAIEESQRRKIGSELHDGISGSMAAIKMNLSAVKKMHPDLDRSIVFTETQQMVKEAAEEIRRTAHSLIPEILLKNGLNQAIIAHINRFKNNTGLNIEYNFLVQPPDLRPDVNLTLFRIIQELLQNIIKHADAKHASIQLFENKEKINLIVEDDGVGFDVQHSGFGIGLDNIKTRVQSLEGELDVQSVVGKQTVIRITFKKSFLV